MKRFFDKMGTLKRKFKVEYIIDSVSTNKGDFKEKVSVQIKRGTHKVESEIVRFGGECQADFGKERLVMEPLTMFYDDDQKAYVEKEGEIRLVIHSKDSKKVGGVFKFDLAEYLNKGKGRDTQYVQIKEELKSESMTKFELSCEIYLRFLRETNSQAESDMESAVVKKRDQKKNKEKEKEKEKEKRGDGDNRDESGREKEKERMRGKEEKQKEKEKQDGEKKDYRKERKYKEEEVQGEGKELKEQAKDRKEKKNKKVAEQPKKFESGEEDSPRQSKLVFEQRGKDTNSSRKQPNKDDNMAASEVYPYQQRIQNNELDKMFKELVSDRKPQKETKGRAKREEKSELFIPGASPVKSVEAPKAPNTKSKQTIEQPNSSPTLRNKNKDKDKDKPKPNSNPNPYPSPNSYPNANPYYQEEISLLQKQQSQLTQKHNQLKSKEQQLKNEIKEQERLQKAGVVDIRSTTLKSVQSFTRTIKELESSLNSLQKENSIDLIRQQELKAKCEELQGVAECEKIEAKNELKAVEKEMGEEVRGLEITLRELKERGNKVESQKLKLQSQRKQLQQEIDEMNQSSDSNKLRDAIDRLEEQKLRVSSAVNKANQGGDEKILEFLQKYIM